MSDDKLTIGVFNDSFPPVIDGVANAALNYAYEIEKNYGRAIVATPWYPNVKDDYPYTVIRYPSRKLSRKLEYRAGYPFNPFVLNQLHKAKMDMIHNHSPFTSAVLARLLRFSDDIPIVFTYHTKFDMEFQRLLPNVAMRSLSAKLLVSNIATSNEVWAVSKGAGENLRSLGYEGDYFVMPNGTDFPKGESSPKIVDGIRRRHNIDKDTPVFLFVGRMMWYKGNRLTINALKIVKNQGYRFKMIFVGDGNDKKDMERYVLNKGLSDDCIFTGAIYDRELIRGYFTLANMFIFPSTYDTNGIVVTEAAACSCPSLLIRGSCAAERVEHMKNAFLCSEDPLDLAGVIMFACDNPDVGRSMGKAAADEIYLSWKDAVGVAHDRYQIVLDSYNSGANQIERRLYALRDIGKMKEELGIKLDSLEEFVLNRQRNIGEKKDLLLNFYRKRHK